MQETNTTHDVHVHPISLLVRFCQQTLIAHGSGLGTQENAKWEYNRRVSKERIQKQLRAVHDHKIFQTAVALMILGNFFCSMVQLQMELGEAEMRVFDQLDVIFTLVFLLELVFNLATHWFLEFWWVDNSPSLHRIVHL